MNIENYLSAKANGTIEKFRGDEISRRIAKKYPLSSQIALLMDKDLKYNEWVEYQAYRAQIKQEVDNEITQIELKLNHGA